MAKTILVTIFFIMYFPNQSSAMNNPRVEKAAFVKKDDLWVKAGKEEKRITVGEDIRYPKWSHDGEWISYLKGSNNDLWLYNCNNDKHVKVKTNVNHNFQWSPRENSLGFLINKDLFVLNKELQIEYIATNIENFSWLPNGSSFLTSWC